MFLVLLLTLASFLLLIVVYDQYKYRLHVRSVKEGVVGGIVPYRTPHNLFEIFSTIKSVVKAVRSNVKWLS